MKNKAFTLVELLGVVVVLGILALVSLPPIINQIKNMREKVSSATLKIIYSSVDKYMANNRNDFPEVEDTSYCVTLEQLVNGGVLSEPINDSTTGAEINLNRQVMIDLGTGFVKTYKLYAEHESCPYVDESGAKAPELVEGMIPITRSLDNKWVKADVDSEWYNYNDREWANAVLVTKNRVNYYKNAPADIEVLEADILMYYVWIPRFRYKLFNTSFLATTPRQIEVIFEGKRTTKSLNTTNGKWLTHPAFTFGTNELNGIWVGKFEVGFEGATSAATAQVSTPEPNKAIIKPYRYAWRNLNVSNMYNVVKMFTDNGNIYSLSNDADSHLMKNMEWGSVAYLSHSKYGNPDPIWTNPNTSYLTGCAGNTETSAATSTCNQYSTANGLRASTTGNIYGIYDMVGGGREYVMGAIYNVGNSTIAISSSGFTQSAIDHANMLKYINKYNYGTTFSDQTAYNRSQLGDATGETRGWNSDENSMIYNTNPWMLRGGLTTSNAGSGLFNFNRNNGVSNIAYSFRAVIAKK
jgi:prepilin-type N-terminal cleavage/methylation domain-containing protein